MDELSAAQITYLILFRRLAELVVNFSATGTHQPADQAFFFSQPLVIRGQFDHGQMVTILNQFPERLGLSNVSWITVQNKCILSVIALDPLRNETGDDLI